MRVLEEEKTYHHQLRGIQRLEYQVLKDFDKLCRENGLQYFLCFGTLLGAVRHKGFIPWDDDIDIMMLRPDYDRLCKIAPKQLDSRYFWQDYKTDRASGYLYRKIRVNDTVMATESYLHSKDMHHGVFIDIFVSDYTSDNRLLSQLHIAVTYLLGAMVTTKWTGIPRKSKLKMITTLALPLLKIIPMSWLQRAYDFSAAFFSRRRRHGNYLIASNDIDLPRGRYPSRWFKEEILTEFEQGWFPIPLENEEYLSWLYGDYRQLPPPEARSSGHTLIQVDLGDYEYLNC